MSMEYGFRNKYERNEFTQAVAELDSPVARMLEEKDAEIERLKAELDAIGQMIGNAIDVAVLKQAKKDALLEAADMFVQQSRHEASYELRRMAEGIK